MLSNVFDNQTRFVCYRVADMAAPKCRRFAAHAMVATRPLGYRRNRLPHRPRFVLRFTGLAGRETERFPKCSIPTLSTV